MCEHRPLGIVLPPPPVWKKKDNEWTPGQSGNVRMERWERLD
jgi:hypothetical protein